MISESADDYITTNGKWLIVTLKIIVVAGDATSLSLMLIDAEICWVDAANHVAMTSGAGAYAAIWFVHKRCGTPKTKKIVLQVEIDLVLTEPYPDSDSAVTTR